MQAEPARRRRRPSLVFRPAARRRAARPPRGRALIPGLQVLETRDLLSGVTFTGHAASDFGAVDGSVSIPVDIGPGEIAGPSGSTPGQLVYGFDMKAIWLDYDGTTDTLYVGVQGYPNVANLEEIFGDLSGTQDAAEDDYASATNTFGNLKGVAFAFAPEDGDSPLGAKDFAPTVVAGIPTAFPPPLPSKPIPPSPDFEVAYYDDEDKLGLTGSFGPAYFDGGSLAFNTTAATPDFEFTINDFTRDSGVDPSDGLGLEAEAKAEIPGVENPPVETGWLSVPPLAGVGLQSIVADPIARDPSDGGLDYGYTISGASLPQPTTVNVYWAGGTTTSSEIGSPIASTTTETAIGSYDLHLSPSQIGTRPAGATDLLVVADPGGLVPLGGDGKVTYLPLPSIEPASLAFDATDADDGVTYTYSIFAPLPGATTVSLYWADGPTAGSILGAPISTTATGTAVGTSAPTRVPESAFADPPQGATNLLLVVDPGHLVPDSDAPANVLSLSLDPDIRLDDLEVVDGDDTFDYDFETTDDLVPFDVSLYDSPTPTFDPATAVPVTDPQTGAAVVQAVDPSAADEASTIGSLVLTGPAPDPLDYPYVAIVATPVDRIGLLNAAGNFAVASFQPVVSGQLEVRYSDRPAPPVTDQGQVFSGDDIQIAMLDPTFLDYRPLLNIQGTATVGDSTITVDGSVSAAIGDKPTLFSGSWSIPVGGGAAALSAASTPDLLATSAFNALAGLSATSLTLAPGEIRLAGNFGLPGLPGSPSQAAGTLVVDASGEDLNIGYLPLGSAFSLTDIEIQGQAGTNLKLSGQATLNMPAGLKANATFGVQNGRFQSLGVSLIGTNRPLGAMGLYLQAFCGTLNLSSDSPSFQVAVTVTVGPHINLVLPGWTGLPNPNGSLLTIKGQAILDSNGFTLKDVAISGIIDATGSASLNWTTMHLEFHVNTSFFLGTFRSALDIVANPDLLDAKSSVTFNPTAFLNLLPTALKNLLNRALPDGALSASFELNYSTKLPPSASFLQVEVSATVSIRQAVGVVNRSAVLGLLVPLDGSPPRPIVMIEQPNGNMMVWDQAPLDQAGNPVLQAIAAGPEVAGGGVARSYLVAPGTSALMLAAQWAGQRAVTGLEIVAPDGTARSLASLSRDARGLGVRVARQPGFASVMIDDPEPGRWTIRLAGGARDARADLSGFVGQPAPVLKLGSAKVERGGKSVAIGYDVAGAGPSSQVELFVSKSRTGVGSSPIAAEPASGRGPGRIIWNLADVPAGRYYVHAILVGGEGAVPDVRLARPVVVARTSSGASRGVRRRVRS